MKQSFSNSIINALKGLYVGIKNHRNIKIMLVIALLVFFTGRQYQLVRFEWAVVWLCFGFVLTLELINTAIEELLDHLHPSKHPAVGKAKDIAAGAVLLACIISGIVGLYIFLPHILY